jgi:hypothetical protein
MLAPLFGPGRRIISVTGAGASDAYAIQCATEVALAA